jgi:hypothetical protein
VGRSRGRDREPSGLGGSEGKREIRGSFLGREKERRLEEGDDTDTWGLPVRERRPLPLRIFSRVGHGLESVLGQSGLLGPILFSPFFFLSFFILF